MARAIAMRCFLTAGELAASFADAGIVTIGSGHDELVGIGGACCRDDLVRTGLGIRIPDVVGDGAVEQELILEDNPNLLRNVSRSSFRIS